MNKNNKSNSLISSIKKTRIRSCDIGFSTREQVKENKKGKGSYRRSRLSKIDCNGSGPSSYAYITLCA